MPFPGIMRLSVVWQDSKEDIHPHLSRYAYVLPGKAGEFKTMTMMVSVPQGAEYMTFGLLGTNVASGEKVIFSDAAVYKLFD